MTPTKPPQDGGTPTPLSPISKESVQAFDAVIARVEADVTHKCLAEDDPHETMGPDAEEKIRKGLTFVTRMLRATMNFGAKGILEDELSWGETRLPVYGVSMEMVLKNFLRYTKSLQTHLPTEAFNEVRPYLDQMVAMQQQMAPKGE